MALSQKLELRQSQSLVMTPQLQQAIKLLQLSNLELASYVEGELERNPLLERDESPKPDAPLAEPAEAPRPDAAGEPLMAMDVELASREAPPDAATSDLDLDYDNLYADRSRAEAAESGEAHGAKIDWSGAKGGSTRFADDELDLEGRLSETPSLRSHLEAQLGIACPSPRDRLIGAYLIDLVDEAGYVRGEIGEAALRLGTSPAEVERVLAVMQRFEPTGVMARSLQECLALQLREQDRLDPAMAMLLTRLEDVARRDIPSLARACAVEPTEIVEMIDELKRLNPKPGLAFGHEAVQPVVPDVFVREGQDGGWIVELNAETLPRLLVNQRFYAEVNRTASRREDKLYLSECYQSANWLVRSLEQRATTILKVASEIVRQQDGFLARGVTHLRPLNLRAIADAISMHESTVSRVTANKYIATKRGIFELKYFFTSAIAAADGGEAHSAEAVRHRIRELIEGESPRAILSDDRIVDLLREAGVDIARRTVAKYREALRIPSSVQRRRLKMAAM